MGARFQYAVKFICGKSDGTVVAPGNYWTAINLHNPSTDRAVIRKKIAVALPREKTGPISAFFDATLGPDEALEIDRDDIVEHSPVPGEFIKGFVVIYSDFDLDVVAVYTAAGANEHVETLTIDRILPRQLLLPDLVPVNPDPEAGELGFCKTVAQGPDKGKLVITIRNQGTAAVGPTTTRIDFFKHGQVDVPTPGLAPGNEIALLVEFPPLGDFEGELPFRIIADVNNEVIESGEENNSANGKCFIVQ